MLSVQAFINMAVAVNLIPVTGQPLPLVSRGGTSTLITCIYFGLILSADRFGIGQKKRDEEHIDRSDAGPHDEDSPGSHDSSGGVTRPVNQLGDKVEFEIIQV